MHTRASDEHILELPQMGMRTRVIDRGTGPVVLFLHGNPDNAEEWRLVMERISDKYRCIAPDFPGYGKSPELPDGFSYSLNDQQRFVDEILRVTGASGPITLVVHDTGGMVGTAWARANAHRLLGVVYTNTMVFEGFQWFAVARQWGDESLRGRLRSAIGMAALGPRNGALFRRIFGKQSPQLSQAQLDRFVESFALNRLAKRATLRQFRAFMKPDFFAGFERMRLELTESVPCRVLWGDDDPYLPTALSQRFGKAAVTVLPRVGHWVALIAPTKLADEIRALG
jgi:haloalkane dehalogenase